MISAREATEFLHSYNYDNATESNVAKIFDAAWKAKANLRNIFQHHPQWDEDQQAIIFTADFETGINKEDLKKFSDWMMENKRDLPGELLDFIFDIRFIDTQFTTAEFVTKVNELFNIGATEGQKVSRIINKIGKSLECDKIKDIKPIWQNGEQREKDYGWNYYFAMLGDALNPIKISKYTVISINPMDYWTMSFGKGWASCHTIDKENVRRDKHNYEGCYSGGTESYMLDQTSVVFYTVDKNYVGEMWKADKGRRMMFHIANGDEFIFGRLYPDGRDGGETGLAAQFRNCIQKVLSDCTNESNLWTLQKGTEICAEKAYSYGSHFKDYIRYKDCGYSLRKGKYSVGKINIGSAGICPSCGCETTNEQNIQCESCADSYECYCERCGAGLYYDDAIYCEDNDYYYCDSDCADRDGVHYCSDDGCFHNENNCFCDDSDGDYYYDDTEMVITENGFTYRSYEVAINEGYAQDDDGCWWPEDEVYYDENREIHFHEDYDTVHTRFGSFIDEDSAMEFGLICIDGEWYKEIDTLIDETTGEIFVPDGNEIRTEYGDFINKTNAYKFGLAECCGEFIKVEEVA
jgi:hypothetical protein